MPSPTHPAPHNRRLRHTTLLLPFKRRTRAVLQNRRHGDRLRHPRRPRPTVSRRIIRHDATKMQVIAIHKDQQSVQEQHELGGAKHASRHSAPPHAPLARAVHVHRDRDVVRGAVVGVADARALHEHVQVAGQRGGRGEPEQRGGKVGSERSARVEEAPLLRVQRRREREDREERQDGDDQGGDEGGAGLGWRVSRC